MSITNVHPTLNTRNSHIQSLMCIYKFKCNYSVWEHIKLPSFVITCGWWFLYKGQNSVNNWNSSEKILTMYYNVTPHLLTQYQHFIFSVLMFILFCLLPVLNKFSINQYFLSVHVMIFFFNSHAVFIRI